MKTPHLVISSLLTLGCVNLTRPPELAQPRAGGIDATAEPLDAPASEADGAAPDTAIDASLAAALRQDGPEPADLPPAVPAPPADAALLGNAARCDRGDQCQSGACQSGVCCAEACNRRCFACNLPGSEGTCAPIPAGQADVARCPTEALGSCGLDGTCDGKGGCRRYIDGTVCVPGGCSDATEVGARTCDGNGTCRMPSTRSCAPNVCMGTSCGTRCTSASECQTGFFCDAGVCRVKRGVGEACKLAVECGSGNCIDGVCCSSACTQFCFSCAVPGSVGSCVAVPAGEDLRGNCSAEPASTCGRDGRCDGKGGCRLQVAGTECVPAACSNGIALGARTCNGLGVCGGGASARDCGTFACAGNTCGASCAMNNQCQGSALCAGTTCAVPDLVLYWKLDETMGTVAEDASGGGHPGTYLGETGIPAPSTVLPPVKFLDGGSRLFVGAQRQFIELAPMPAAVKPTAELTLSAWYRATTTDGGGGEIISGGNNYLLRVKSTEIEFDKRVANQHIRCFAMVPNHLDGNWHHLALVVDAAELKGYVDGIQRCATANTDSMAYDQGNAFRVGRHGQTADNFDFDGNIDEVRVYRRALKQPEVADLAMGGR
jgi:hypothetical protein